MTTTAGDYVTHSLKWSRFVKLEDMVFKFFEVDSKKVSNLFVVDVLRGYVLWCYGVAL